MLASTVKTSYSAAAKQLAAVGSILFQGNIFHKLWLGLTRLMESTGPN